MIEAVVCFALVASVAWFLLSAVFDWKARVARTRRLGFECCEGRLVLTPIASVSAVDATEGGYVFATVELDSMTEQQTSVGLTVVGLTATPEVDFFIIGEQSGVFTTVVTFEPWEVSRSVLIGTVDDSLYEDPESLRVDLSNPIGLALSTTLSSATAHIIDDEINYPPTAGTIPDQFRWEEDEEEIVLWLGEYFSDSNDELSSFSWGVTYSGGSGLTSTYVDSCQFLHLEFATGVAGVSDVVVRGTDPHGEYADASFKQWSVRVGPVGVEENYWGGTEQTWEPVTSDILWTSETHRWTTTVEPASVAPYIEVNWMAEPWVGQTAPTGQSAFIFATELGLTPAAGSPGSGDWYVYPRAIMGGLFVAAFSE